MKYNKIINASNEIIHVFVSSQILKTFPGFMIPFGSKVFLISFMTLTVVEPNISSSRSIFPRPMPCSPVQVPPSAKALKMEEIKIQDFFYLSHGWFSTFVQLVTHLAPIFCGSLKSSQKYLRHSNTAYYRSNIGKLNIIHFFLTQWCTWRELAAHYCGCEPLICQFTPNLINRLSSLLFTYGQRCAE